MEPDLQEKYDLPEPIPEPQGDGYLGEHDLVLPGPADPWENAY